MPTLNPANNFDHLLQIVSGGNTPHDLELRGATPGTGVTFNRGALLSRNNSTGLLQLGCPTGKEMPLFSKHASVDFDAFHDDGSFDPPNAPALLPGIGAYEIFTSEYVSGSYTYNDVLTAGTSSNAGKVTEAGANYNDTIVVGHVSRGVQADYNGVNVLYFWTNFMPAVAISGS